MLLTMEEYGLTKDDRDAILEMNTLKVRKGEEWGGKGGGEGGERRGGERGREGGRGEGMGKHES